MLLTLSLVACRSGAPDPDGAVDGVDGGGFDGGIGFDAGPPEMCPRPGALEVVPCGACGSVERFCTAGGTWAYGDCESEGGACVPGTTREETCGACGTQQARCSDRCTWEPMGECRGEGGCVPGTAQRSAEGCPPGEIREVLCTDACSFEPLGACVANDCARPGVLETVECGMCGAQERFCSAAGVWEYGLCEGGGACVPGTTESADCGRCGTQRRRCTVECVWETTGECMDEGDCAPGDTTRTSAGCPAGQTRPLRCGDACVFEEAGMCGGSTTECRPACAPGETCNAAGECRCGSGAACPLGVACVGGVCMHDPGSCPDASMYGCRLVAPQCGCTGTQACDVDRTARTRICRVDGTAGDAQACGETTRCRAGMTCAFGQCHRWCERDGDCPGRARCAFRRADTDGGTLPFPAQYCSHVCNPLNAEGCPAGDACEVVSDTASFAGTAAVTKCRAVAPAGLPFGCLGIQTECAVGQHCLTDGGGIGLGGCARYCRVGRSDCASGTCNPLPGAPEIDGSRWGTCG